MGHSWTPPGAAACLANAPMRLHHRPPHPLASAVPLRPPTLPHLPVPHFAPPCLFLLFFSVSHFLLAVVFSTFSSYRCNLSSPLHASSLFLILFQIDRDLVVFWSCFAPGRCGVGLSAFLVWLEGLWRRFHSVVSWMLLECTSLPCALSQFRDWVVVRSGKSSWLRWNRLSTCSLVFVRMVFSRGSCVKLYLC